jgi:chromatin remodeling complex protein RSC6
MPGGPMPAMEEVTVAWSNRQRGRRPNAIIRHRQPREALAEQSARAFFWHSGDRFRPGVDPSGELRSSLTMGGTMATKTKRKPNAAFMKPMTPSAALAAVIGDKPMPRTEVTKRIWAYIKRKKLQDSKNKRMINADEALKPIFGGKRQVSMFDMTKLVSKNLK